MATRFECVLVDDGRGEARLRAAAEAALAVIAELDQRLSRFRGDSLLAFLEREAVERAVPLDDDMLALFTEAIDVWHASQGLFDITLGATMDALAAGHEPVEAAASLRGPGGPPPFELSGRALRLRPGVRLDLGGIAKGHAIDLALAALREQGIAQAFLHGGTSAVGALGAPPDADAWLVEVAMPAGHDASSVSQPLSPPFRMAPTGDGAAGPRLVVALRDGALAVSAPHGRVVDGQHHIIDPRSGTSARSAALAAISGPSCRACDAWTKPALILASRPPALPAECSAAIVPASS